jgi:acetylglutamate kinase
MASGFVPVVSPISMFVENRPPNAAGFINVNGDPIAVEIAAAVQAARFVYMTDVDGVLDF